MYITINEKDEKRIDLSYPIYPRKEIAVVRMFNGNIQYEIAKPRTIMDPISDNKKLPPSRTHAGRELIYMLEGMVELTQFVADD